MASRGNCGVNASGTNGVFDLQLGADSGLWRDLSLRTSGAPNGLVLKGTSGNVGIGTTAPSFKLEVIDPANKGLRVHTNASGGTVASFGFFGDFQIDAFGVVGARFAVKENGNVGIGTASPANKLHIHGGGLTFSDPNGFANQNRFAWFNNPTSTGVLALEARDDANGFVRSLLAVQHTGNVGIGTASPAEKLSVAGTVESTSGGFKFPDGSIQTTATTAGNTTFTTVRTDGPVVPNTGPSESILHLALPTAGIYLVTATVHFWNSNFTVNTENSRTFHCAFNAGPFNGDDLDYYVSLTGNNRMTITYHAVLNLTNPVAFVDLKCRGGSVNNETNQNGVFAYDRRLTAVQIPGNLVVQ